MTSHIYDLIIIGSGPAGLAAAVYAQRACLDTLVIEGSTVSGGQILNTYEVDNYPGYPGISGYELGMKMREHADKLGAHFKEDTVLKIEDKGPKEVKRVIGMNATYEARTLIREAERNGIEIEVLDLDHDLGDFANQGGDAIKLLDWLVERETFYPVEIHTANPVGRANMESVLARYWGEEYW